MELASQENSCQPQDALNLLASSTIAITILVCQTCRNEPVRSNKIASRGTMKSGRLFQNHSYMSTYLVTFQTLD